MKLLRQWTPRVGLFLTWVLTFSFYACSHLESDRGAADIAQGQIDLEKRLKRSESPEQPNHVSRKEEKGTKRTALLMPAKPVSKQPKAPPKSSTAFPNFASIEDTKKRKMRFFEFMQPLIQAENTRVKKQRLQILSLYDAFKDSRTLSTYDREWLQRLCEEYRVPSTDVPTERTFRQLLVHVDIVPLELALAQAAIESAWGRSRFAYRGNNIFGEWCFKKGCGMVPEGRAPGATYEVAVFRSPIRSVRSYIRNLNSHPAYSQFRILRSEKRLVGERPDGHTLALGLQKYSGLGMDYVNRLRSIMRQNKDLIPMPEVELALYVDHRD